MSYTPTIVGIRETGDVIMLLGMQRKVDNLGRIVLPKELRKLYNINDDDYVEIIPTETGILIKKPNHKLICLDNK